MVIDTFTHVVQIGANGTLPVKVNAVQFGDGYKQVSESGINPSSEIWILTSRERLAKSKEVLGFLESHCAKSFYWTNPWGDKKLYRVKADSITPTFINGQFVEIAFTFEQAFAP